MAKTNDIIENPIMGDIVKFLITSHDSNSQNLKVYVWNTVGAQRPPEHRHPKQIETFVIVSGTAGFKLNGKEQILTSGQTVTVPMNTPHKFWNAGSNELEMTGELKPALRTEFFLETMYSLSQKGKVNKNAIPKNFCIL
ncbi:MAG: cupin domain-containing protein [Ferruginibacter sp.]